MKEKVFLTLEGKELMPRPEGACFIVFEGIDGSGKSTAAKGLCEYLRAKGVDAMLTKEPSLESEAGRKIRDILAGKASASPEDRQMLFTEDRRDHVERVILPALRAGRVVISDRYFFSTFAFGAATGVDMERLIELNKEFVMPDLVLLVSVRPEVGLARVQVRGEGTELHDRVDVLEKTNEAYEALAKRFPNFRKVDGEQSIEVTASRVSALADEILKEERGGA